MNDTLVPAQSTPGRLPAGYELLLLAFITFAVFGPALDNGFISDDFVFLERVESLARDPAYLFSIPPEHFRSWTYVFFLVLKRSAGYLPFFFYLTTLLIHAANAFLLGHLLRTIGFGAGAGLSAAILFAAYERPQEAFLWLGGSHELFQGAAILLFLLSWCRGHRFLALAAYLLSLLAKESAPISLPLLALVENARGLFFRWHKEFLGLGLLTLLQAGLLFSSWKSNSLVAGGFYAFGPAAIPVLLHSLNRLAFPWLYLFAGLAIVYRLRPVSLPGVAAVARHRLPPPSPTSTRKPHSQQLRYLGIAALGWMVVAQLPYIFLTYMDHLPSRHQYLASMGLCMILALFLECLPNLRLRQTLLVVFVSFNAGYFRLGKDAQFELRAAPTTRLIEYQREHSPGEVRIEGFPLNPWIARLTTRLQNGWDPSMIRIVEEGETCSDCPLMRWDPATSSYQRR